VSSVIRNLVLDMKDNSESEYTRLKQRLANDFDFHLDTALFNEQQDLYVTAQYSELCENRSLSLDFNASGSGFMQVLQILAPIYRNCPHNAEIVLLDEPDAHLHPNLQTTLANSLRKIRDELNIQIIISTHSTSIIRSALASEVVPISTSANICQPLNDKKELDDEIRAKIDSYHLAKSVISGKLIFFEDSDTSVIERFDDILNKKVFKGANTSPVIRGRGKTDRVPFQIKEIINELSGEEIEVIFVRDGDGISPEWRTRLMEFASSRGVKLHILEKFEIESYLLNPNLIHKTIQRKYSDKEILPSVEQIEAKIIESLKNTIELAKYDYTYCLEEEIRQNALLLNLGEYRNPQFVTSEVREWRNNLLGLIDLDELLKFGMGKESLKEIFSWLNTDWGINLSKRSLLEDITADSIPNEISEILESLQSNENRGNPEDYERLQIESSDVEDELEDNVFVNDEQYSLFN
jgi:energy-coupling factor transporter ATP-binding protein EcfA2